jgi:hypothetical protein
MFDAGNNHYLSFSNRTSIAKCNFNNFTIFTVTSPLVFPHRQKNEEKFTENFAIFTVTVPLVLPTGTKDSEKFTENFAIFTVTVPLVLPTGTKDLEKFTKISQYSQFQLH